MSATSSPQKGEAGRAKKKQKKETTPNASAPQTAATPLPEDIEAFLEAAKHSAGGKAANSKAGKPRAQTAVNIDQIDQSSLLVSFNDDDDDDDDPKAAPTGSGNTVVKRPATVLLQGSRLVARGPAQAAASGPKAMKAPLRVLRPQASAKGNKAKNSASAPPAPSPRKIAALDGKITKLRKEIEAKKAGASSKKTGASEKQAPAQTAAADPNTHAPENTTSGSAIAATTSMMVASAQLSAAQETISDVVDTGPRRSVGIREAEAESESHTATTGDTISAGGIDFLGLTWGKLLASKEKVAKKLQKVQVLIESNLREELELQGKVRQLASSIKQQETEVQELQDAFNDELISLAERALL